MINVEEISQYEIDVIGELFFEEKSEVFVANTAKFQIEGDVIKCISSRCIHPNSDEDLVDVELKVLRIKKIAEEIFNCKFVDLRKQVNN